MSYHVVQVGDIVDYYDTHQNPNTAYARCEILEIIEDGAGVVLQWYADIESDGYRTYDPDNFDGRGPTRYPHYREKVLHKDRKDIRIVIHRKHIFDEELFTL